MAAVEQLRGAHSRAGAGHHARGASRRPGRARRQVPAAGLPAKRP